MIRNRMIPAFPFTPGDFTLGGGSGAGGSVRALTLRAACSALWSTGGSGSATTVSSGSGAGSLSSPPAPATCWSSGSVNSAPGSAPSVLCAADLIGLAITSISPWAALTFASR